MSDIARRVIGAVVFPSPEMRTHIDDQWKGHMRRSVIGPYGQGELFKLVSKNEHPTEYEVKEKEVVFARVIQGRYDEIWILGEHPSDLLFLLMRAIPKGTEVRNCATAGSSLDCYLSIFHSLRRA